FDRAQDWELNYRLRHSGREVWFSPRLKVTYRPRSDVKSLATQFFHTGQWRRQVIRTHRDSASLRYLAAPATVVACTAGAIGGATGIVRSVLRGRPSRLLAGFAVPAGYLAAMTAGSLLLKQPLKPAVRARLPLVLTVMHMSWGAGFIVGLPAPRAQ
ncbi:MAG: glycosyltransferase family 2 protein, partial [Cutibacterium granulosum]|nr:glycosyltransferase family 2 protein [Cutibacterium granulosum]